MIKKILFLSLLLMPYTVRAQAWNYLGIPYTDWSYDPFTISYQRPTEWDASPSSPVTNKYYISPEHPNASDTNNPYGHPDHPRATFPTNGWIGDIFPAGTLFYMEGAFTPQQFSGIKDYNPTLNGTAANPVFFVGNPTNPPTISGFNLRLIASEHVIFDGIHWSGGNPRNEVLSLSRSDRFFETHHITIKNCRFENLNYIAGGAGIITIFGPGDKTVNNVVVYRNVFKGCGGGFDWYSRDGDQHGIHPSARAYRIWVIENDAQPGDTPDPIDGVRKAISGNLCQVGGNTNDHTALHHIYCAGNSARAGGMRQGLLWTKNCNKVIFSQNYCNRMNQNFSADNGQSFGSQYDAANHWFIFNTSENALAGWMHTDNGGQRPGPHIIYGNIFRNLNSNGLNAVNSFKRAGVSLWNNRNDHFIVNNTMQNVESAVSINGSSPIGVTMTIKNNLISGLQGIEQRFVSLGQGGATYDIDNNLFHSTGLWIADVNGIRHTSVTSLNATTSVDNNFATNPLFVSPPADLSVTANSPARDAGTSSTDIPALFANTFMNDPDYPATPNISFAINGTLRNQGDNVDVGAYEFSSTGDNDQDMIPDDEDPDDDNDYLPDPLELQLGLNPLLRDSDSNGIPDGDEDSDGDGQSNAAEFLTVLTDPADINSNFTAQLSYVSGQAKIRFSGLALRSYQIFGSTNMKTWTPLLTSPLTPTKNQLLEQELSTTGGHKFFRVEVSRSQN